MNNGERTRGPLGVCILGCGMMGNIHAAHWQALPEAHIVAVVDILDERAQAMAQLYGLDTWYNDYRRDEHPGHAARQARVVRKAHGLAHRTG